MIPTIVYVLLVAHFVADFISQSDWMAVNKSKDWAVLAVHVVAYMTTGLLPAAVIGVLIGHSRLGDPILWLMVNAAAHFVQDAITSRITSRLWFFERAAGIWTQAEHTYPKHGQTIINPWLPLDGKRHWFFVMIGFDQLLHYVTLFVTASWWLQ